MSVADGVPIALDLVAVSVAVTDNTALRVSVADNVPTALVGDADIVPIGVPIPCKFLIFSELPKLLFINTPFVGEKLLADKIIGDKMKFNKINNFLIFSIYYMVIK